MPVVGKRCNGADPAIGVIEEAGNESCLKDLMIVEPCLAQLVHLLLIDLLWVSRYIPGVLAKGIIFLGKHSLAGTVVVAEPVNQGGVLPHAAEIIPMCGEAIGAAVVGGYHNADHFLLGIG